MSDRAYLEQICRQFDMSLEETCEEIGIKYEEILKELK